MGLDMNLYRTSRKHFESIDREDFWQIAQEQEEELMCWRKKYEIDSWFSENLLIIEDYSYEVTKEILEKFVNWLIENKLKEDAEKIKEIISTDNFEENVIYYTRIN